MCSFITDSITLEIKYSECLSEFVCEYMLIEVKWNFYLVCLKSIGYVLCSLITNSIIAKIKFGECLFQCMWTYICLMEV